MKGMWPFSFGLESTTLEGDELGVSSVSFTEEVIEMELAKFLHNKSKAETPLFLMEYSS